MSSYGLHAVSICFQSHFEYVINNISFVDEIRKGRRKCGTTYYVTFEKISIYIYITILIYEDIAFKH